MQIVALLLCARFHEHGRGRTLCLVRAAAHHVRATPSGRYRASAGASRSRMRILRPGSLHQGIFQGCRHDTCKMASSNLCILSFSHIKIATCRRPCCCPRSPRTRPLCPFSKCTGKREAPRREKERAPVAQRPHISSVGTRSPAISSLRRGHWRRCPILRFLVRNASYLGTARCKCGPYRPRI